MNSFISTLRMEFRGRFGLGKTPTKKAWGVFAINIIVDAVIYGIFLAILYFLSSMLLRGNMNVGYEYLVLATVISVLVQLFTSTGRLIKVLYSDVDNELLLRFPLDGMDLFLAKSAYALLFNLMISVLFTLPFYVFYGVFTDAGAAFYVMAVGISIFAGLFPFFLANIISVPVMYLNNKIHNKFGLKLVFVIFGLAAAFSLYMLILRGILEYYKTSEAAVIFSEDFLSTLTNIAEAFIPCSYFANLLYGRKIILSVVLSIVITFIFGAISIYLAHRSYYPTLLKCLERGKTAFTKKTNDKPRSQFSAIFLTEGKLIFRSFSYSFQYLAMAIAAPIMVYFCNNLAVAVGDSAVGGAIVPGLTLMVILIFDTIIVSFASTTVSRNGESFYLTKIFPVPYKLQISAKMALYLLVGGASTLVSCGIAWAAFGGERYGGYFGITDFFSIFSISLLIITAMSAVAVLSDLKSPVFEVNGEGDLVKANKNMGGNMIMGIFVAVIYGLVAMIFTYIPLGALSMGISGAYLILAIVSIVIAAGTLVWLYARTDKLYNKIMP